MLLGIPFHVFMSYRAGREWIVTSGEGAGVYFYLAEFIHLFRMPAFFVVAGYFSALLLGRRMPGIWLKGRMTRLAIPFVSAMFLLNPLMNLACEISVYPRGEAWSSFLHNSATSGGYWVRHLWFIIVLLYCCACTALVMKVAPSLRQAMLPARIDRWAVGYAVPVLMVVAVLLGLWEAAAVEAFYMAGLATNGPQQIMRLDELIQFAPWFMLGLMLERAPRFCTRLYSLSGPMVMIAMLASTVSLLGIDYLGPMQGRFVATIAGLSLTQCAIAACHEMANRPHPVVRKLVDASFTIYLFHMPIIIGLVVLGKAVAIPLALKVTLVIFLTFALSYGAWAIVSQSRMLMFLFDGRKKFEGGKPLSSLSSISGELAPYHS